MKKISIVAMFALVNLTCLGFAQAEVPSAKAKNELCAKTKKVAVITQKMRQTGYTEQQLIKMADGNELTVNLVAFIFTQSEEAKPESMGKAMFELCRANAGL